MLNAGAGAQRGRRQRRQAADAVDAAARGRSEHDADGEPAQAVGVGSGSHRYGVRSRDEHRQRLQRRAGGPAARRSRGSRRRGGSVAASADRSGPATVAGLTADPNSSTRVVMQFPAKAEDMLLSGTLERGDLLSNRAGARR